MSGTIFHLTLAMALFITTHLVMSARVVRSVLMGVLGGYTTPNPGVMGMEGMGLRSGARGVLKITRHPVMWGVALWGLCHVLGTGHLSALIFFGAITVLALVGARHIDIKRRANHGDAWNRFEAATSFWPLGAIITGKARVEKGEIP